MTSYSAPTASSFAEATARWGEAAAKNETAFNAAFGTDLASFDYVKSKADRGLPEIFAGYMRSMGKVRV